MFSSIVHARALARKAAVHRHRHSLQAVRSAAAATRQFSDSVDIGIPKDSQGAPMAFPWRSNHIRWTGWRALADVVKMPYMRVAYPHIFGQGFAEGARLAFIHVAAGAFQMRTSEMLDLTFSLNEVAPTAPISEWHSEPRKGEGDVVDPRAVMDTELAEFFTGACVAASAAEMKPVYRLHVCSFPILVRVQHISPGLGETESERTRRDIIPSLVQIVTRPPTDIRGTLKVDVIVPCIETFFVEDKRNKQIVQGRRNIEQRYHVLRLECDIEQLLQGGEGWKATDLDGWIQEGRQN